MDRSKFDLLSRNVFITFSDRTQKKLARLSIIKMILTIRMNIGWLSELLLLNLYWKRTLDCVHKLKAILLLPRFLCTFFLHWDAAVDDDEERLCGRLCMCVRHCASLQRTQPLWICYGKPLSFGQTHEILFCFYSACALLQKIFVFFFTFF